MVGPDTFGPLTDQSLDEETPRLECLSAKYKRSFAYITVKDRLPVILTKVVDHLYRDKLQIIEEYGEDAKEELKHIIGKFSKLKNEIQTNKPIIPLTSEAPDVEQWNSQISKFSKDEKPPRWFESPWLLVECYMYRRIREAFEISTSLKNFDPFRKQKNEGFYASLPAILSLASYLEKVVKESANKTMEIKLELFQFIQVSLWGNKCDMSLSAGDDNSQKLDPIAQLEILQNNILVNNLEEAWKVLSAKSSDQIIDIILDNSGFELFTDLCLADYLISSNLAKTIQFHAKVIPWFVSDVTKVDFFWTIEQLKVKIPELGSRWQDYLDEGRWKLQPESESHFWTMPCPYKCMHEVDPELYSTLQKSTLVIFKGDLNYRKIVGDKNFDPLTSFHSCVGIDVKLLALRTLKADVVVGLTEEQVLELSTSHKDWMVSGKFAVIQYVHLNQLEK